jgi:hypothetical protein
MANLPAGYARAVHHLEPMRLNLEKALVARQFLRRQSPGRQRQSFRCVALNLLGQARHAAQFYGTSPQAATCIIHFTDLEQSVLRGELLVFEQKRNKIWARGNGPSNKTLPMTNSECRMTKNAK